jgi:hypothetical protein
MARGKADPAAVPGEMRGVKRTLAVLRALNQHNGERVSDLARLTEIPRPSLYRVLETLCALGYVRRTDEDRYELMLLVRTLSDGFSDEPWVRGVAQPVMEDLQREIVWPTDLATFYGNAMYLRATTRRLSPLTIDTATAGLRLPSSSRRQGAPTSRSARTPSATRSWRTCGARGRLRTGAPATRTMCGT